MLSLIFIPFGILRGKRDLTKNKIMIDGNAAAALGAVYGGATVVSWYPITPSTSLVSSFEKYAQKCA